MTVILTVEDEFLVSEFLGHILTSAGYEVIAATNADDAIAILEERNDVRIVITDVNMPGSMDGVKLTVGARVDGRRVKTSYGPPDPNDVDVIPRSVILAGCSPHHRRGGFGTFIFRELKDRCSAS